MIFKQRTALLFLGMRMAVAKGVDVAVRDLKESPM